MANPAPRAGGEALAEDPTAASSIRRYEERLARDPSSLAFAPLADAYRKAGRTREAIRLCREGLGRFPHYTTARLILAKALLDDGDVERALAEAEVILEANPREAQAHRVAAEGCRRQGRLDEAVAHLRQAARLDPQDRETRALLDVLSGGGAAPQGSSLERVLADDTFATLSFGAACLEQGLVDEAAQVFLRMLRKEPGHARARDRLEEALRAKTQKRKGS
ncbi:MAG TPA: tetratricopeptide repeat protein [Methylomirabilota bacterium]|nr:tetratricopeptide repeat protein [Methylomirabilota bacterium]